MTIDSKPIEKVVLRYKPGRLHFALTAIIALVLSGIRTAWYYNKFHIWPIYDSQSFIIPILFLIGFVALMSIGYIAALIYRAIRKIELTRDGILISKFWIFKKRVPWNLVSIDLVKRLNYYIVIEIDKRTFWISCEHSNWNEAITLLQNMNLLPRGEPNFISSKEYIENKPDVVHHTTSIVEYLLLIFFIVMTVKSVIDGLNTFPYDPNDKNWKLRKYDHIYLDSPESE